MKQVFKVNESKMDWLEEYIAKVNKRAVKLGQKKVQHQVIGESWEEIKIMGYDDDGTQTGEEIKAVIKVFEVEVEAEPIKMGDYRFVALLDHTYGEKNLVHTVEEIELPQEYYTAKSVCQHCNTNRRRKYTVVLKSESTGEFIQVGKSCLRDFIGYDVENELKFRDLLNELVADVREKGCYMGDGYEAYVEIAQYLVFVEQEIDQHGYMSKSNCERFEESTAYIAEVKMNSHINKGKEKLAPSEFILEAVEWIRNEADLKNEYMRNLNTICGSDYIRHKNFGFVSSLLPTYQRYLDDKRKQELKAKFDGESEYVGAIGKRQDFNVLVEKVIGYETDFGYMHINLMRDEVGNIIVWKSGNVVGEEGKQVRLKGTIKEHTTYNGAKQTIVTRCKVLEG